MTELDGEVAVADGIERVLRRAFEAEQIGGHVAVDRVGRAGERGGAERHDVGAPATVHQPLTIAQQHLEPRQHVVTESHRLRSLQMGKAGHDGVGMTACLFQQAFAEAPEFRGEAVDRVAQVQTKVGGDLVVARAAGVEFLAGIADAFRQCVLDVHMHVFECIVPLEAAGLDIALDAIQAFEDRIEFAFRENTDGSQHPGVRARAHDVVAVEPTVEGLGGREGLDEGVGRFGEAPPPGFGATVVTATHYGSPVGEREV